MIATVHVHSKVEKAIKQMGLLDNAPKIAALRAREIIDALVNGVRLPYAGRLSRKKDMRMKNMFKFNLGKGYRLVTIKEQDTLYILFVGNHDQCDRWLDTYSKKKLHKIPMPLNVYGVLNQHKNNCQRPGCPDSTINDADFLSGITQKDLRKVFCGLVGNP